MFPTLQDFVVANWKWLTAGSLALIAGFFQLRLHYNQTKESRLKIRELETKLAIPPSEKDTHGINVRSTFHGFDYRALILDSERLTVILNDGRSWVDTNRELLRQRLSKQGRSTRFCFVGPNSPYLDLLIKKNGKARSSQIDELRRSVSVISEITSDLSDVEILGHDRPSPYCMFLSEAQAVVHPYYFLEAGTLPVLSVPAGTDLYSAYSEDARKLLKESYKIARDDFPSPSGA